MVMAVEDRRGPDGFPVVRWEQEVPTGESERSVLAAMEFKIAVVIMIFVFTWVYSSYGEFWSAVFAALIVGGLCVAGDQAFKGGIRVWDVHIPGPEPSPYKAEREARERATAILGKEYCEAVVVPHGETDELYFWVFRGKERSKLDCVGGVPLASLQAFELGTAEEWFLSLAQANLRRTVSAPNWWVIVAPSLGHGVVPVAESGGAKAPIAALHGLLTRRFVIEAADMQLRWKAKLEKSNDKTGTPS